MTWALAYGVSEAAEMMKTTPFAQAVEDLRPWANDLEMDNKTVVLKDKALRLINSEFFENSSVILSYEDQQSFIHMLNVLVEKAVRGLPNPDPKPDRLAKWKGLQESLIELIEQFDNESGDCGAARGCVWAEKIYGILWS
jgi:hypothetical protein